MSTLTAEEFGKMVSDLVDTKTNNQESIQTRTQWVLVDTVNQFRSRYMVEVPFGKFIMNDEVRDRSEWALDTVTMNEAVEFSQSHLGETIVSHRVVSKQEAMKICREDNDYTDGWDDQQLVDNFFTPWKNQSDV